MKKIVIISIIAAILAISAVFIILTNQKFVEPAQPIQTEQIEQKQPESVQPKAEPQKEPVLLDENDMPKSDVNVPEIG